jgi:DNA-binding NtrC family response regulator
MPWISANLSVEWEGTMAETFVLLVEDDESLRKHVAQGLTESRYHVITASDLAGARDVLRERTFHLALLDVHLPDGSGLDLLAEIKDSAAATEVVMLTGHATVEEAIRAMKSGALDFLRKPFKLAELEAVLEKAVQRQALERSNTALQREVARIHPSDGFIGRHAAVRELLHLLARVAETESTVLIRGESGVGKELVARAVHRRSPRSRQPFVVVDCASLHENLLQSELFGHEKGAYTGAVRLKHGLFEVADRGTIFLDEIGELTPQLQVKLLRVLETGVFRRVGGTADIRVDVRVIAATNRSLEVMMKEGDFREDLYYRLNVFSLQIPPLRERAEDVPILVEHFIRNSGMTQKRTARMSDAAMQVLLRYAWPGNVRELENVIERALILCDAGVIEPEHLPLGVRLEPSFRATDEDRRLVTLEELERRYLKRVLAECKGHRQKAANILGISERNLYRKIKELEGVHTVSG